MAATARGFEQRKIDALAKPAERYAERCAERADWDPRGVGDGNVLIALRPVRIQAQQEANEIAGRTLMRDGARPV